jgi:hypothetical protein
MSPELGELRTRGDLAGRTEGDPSHAAGCKTDNLQFFDLFDHGVGNGNQRRRNLDAERLGGLKVDDELESGGLHDRQAGGLSPMRILPV